MDAHPLTFLTLGVIKLLHPNIEVEQSKEKTINSIGYDHNKLKEEFLFYTYDILTKYPYLNQSSLKIIYDELIDKLFIPYDNNKDDVLYTIMRLYNTTWNENNCKNNLMEGINFASSIFRRAIVYATASSKINIELEVLSGEQIIPDKILLLKRYVPFKMVDFENNSFEFIIYPENDKFKMSAVPKQIGSKYGKKLFPDRLRGMKNPRNLKSVEYIAVNGSHAILNYIDKDELQELYNIL